MSLLKRPVLLGLYFVSAAVLPPAASRALSLARAPIDKLKKVPLVILVNARAIDTALNAARGHNVSRNFVEGRPQKYLRFEQTGARSRTRRAAWVLRRARP